MANQALNIQMIKLENLLINLKNPRYDPINNQRDAIATIAHDQGMKLVNLADDIVDKGLNPTELPIVIKGEGESFKVLEGNRRITALKLVSSPSLMKSISLPENLSKYYRAFHHKGKDTLPKLIACVVMAEEDARHWIHLRHTGENQGIGIVPWDGVQTQRFRGSSPALQALELVKESDYLDEMTRKNLSKISITNIGRILGTREAREYIGVEVKGGELLPPDEAAIARLSIIITEIANRIIKVTDLDTKDQRIDYAKDIASRPLPIPLSESKDNNNTSIGSTTSTAGRITSIRRVPASRHTLIPRSFKIAIPQPRINKIYDELRKLNLDNFVNCGAVMFRVFIELSVDDFAKRKTISIKVPITTKTSKHSGSILKINEREMYLREKLTTIADYLYNHSICTKQELQGIRSLIANRYHVLSVDSLNAYVHSKDYSPTPTDLKTNWDNLQIFVERIWTT